MSARPHYKIGRRFLRGKTNSKRGPKSFYKGRGAGNYGVKDNKGFFKYVPTKMPVFVVPDLTGFELKPYVSHGTNKIKIPPPTCPELSLNDCEIDILDIVAPHHKKLREEKRRQAEFQQQQEELEEEDYNEELGVEDEAKASEI